MSAYEKPKKPQDSLGLNVVLTSKELENDPQAQTQLKAIGVSLKPTELDYLGSLALHFYRSPTTLTRDRYEVATKQQFALGDMAEHIAVMGLSNLTIELRKHFGHKHSTLDAKDKR